MEIRTRNLGLAAYIKIQGGTLLEFQTDNRVFVFDSEKSENEWNVLYLGSESYKHDSELMGLRKLFT